MDADANASFGAPFSGPHHDDSSAWCHKVNIGWQSLGGLVRRTFADPRWPVDHQWPDLVGGACFIFACTFELVDPLRVPHCAFALLTVRKVEAEMEAEEEAEEEAEDGGGEREQDIVSGILSICSRHSHTCKPSDSMGRVHTHQHRTDFSPAVRDTQWRRIRKYKNIKKKLSLKLRMRASQIFDLTTRTTPRVPSRVR